MRRVVVTGMGAITPIGLNVEEFWKGIHAGQIGFGPITKFDASEYKAHLAAEVKGFVGKEHMDFKAAKRTLYRANYSNKNECTDFFIENKTQTNQKYSCTYIFN